MRIAFVGKGGSGKTTLASLYAQYMAGSQSTLAIDADINMHMAELLRGSSPTKSRLISEKMASQEIRTYLRGTNQRIVDTAHFKKSTPPGKGSKVIDSTDPNDWLMKRFGEHINKNLTLITVGSYSEEGIASSCYHNNLSVLENILTHTIDRGVLVVDMVAGTDAFAGTLFAQFDLLVFACEPTTRSLAVLKQYQALAEHAHVAANLYVVANKVEDEADYQLIKAVAGKKLIGAVSRSSHLLAVDKGREQLDFAQLDEQDKACFKALEHLLHTQAISMQARLPRLWELHKTYVNQEFVKERFGDLTNQIDTTFHYPKE